MSMIITRLVMIMDTYFHFSHLPYHLSSHIQLFPYFTYHSSQYLKAASSLLPEGYVVQLLTLGPPF